MSNISLEGNASGTGTFTIAAPNTSSNFTLTLPQASGTIALGTGLTGVTDSASPFETALGTGAGGSNTGVNNTFVGYNAGTASTTGTNNTAVGYNTLAANTGGSQNNAVGSGALDANTTGSENTALGHNALGANTSGNSSTAIGRNALILSNGSNNTSVGSDTMGANTTGANNVAIGNNALGSNTTGANNTAVGFNALDSNTTAQYNVAVGIGALGSVTTGVGNTAVGAEAGLDTVALTTGRDNTLIGGFVRTSAAGGNSQIVIGYNVTGQADSNVTIGNASGKIYNAFTVNATWTQTSDGRLKKNIQDDTLGLSFVNRLRPVKYQWKPSNEIDPSLPYYNEVNQRDTETVIHGLIAQEVKEALDAEGVTTFAGWDVGPDTIQAVSREMFISPLIKAIQELKAINDAQATRIETLETKVAALEAQLATPPAEPNA